MSKSKSHSAKFNPIIETDDDTLFIPQVRGWSLEKYRLVGSYCDIFTQGMKNRWDQLVYLDLFAGAGYSHNTDDGKIYKSSALIAMSIPHPFTKYILCESDPERYEALSKRLVREFSHLNYKLIPGDNDQNVEAILSEIPSFGKGNTMLPFCFLDPYSLNFKFSIVEALSKGLMDFLTLQALHMDGNRNLKSYLNENNERIADYLGMPNWRELFAKDVVKHSNNFVKFLADLYQGQMVKLGYQEEKLMHHIKSNEQHLPLYYLAFYSKSSRGTDFFDKVRRGINSQMSFL
ncbi:MAG: three-Cys-motif partner protein TcmP [Bacteroidota bacterium]